MVFLIFQELHWHEDEDCQCNCGQMAVQEELHPRLVGPFNSYWKANAVAGRILRKLERGEKRWTFQMVSTKSVSGGWHKRDPLTRPSPADIARVGEIQDRIEAARQRHKPAQ